MNRDGLGLNAVDTKRMQDELFQYIVDQIDDRIKEEDYIKEMNKKRKKTTPATEEEDDDDAEDNAAESDVERPTIVHRKNSNGYPVPMFASSYPEKRKSAVYTLSTKARQAREDFNRGWNDMFDIGILNEVINAEIQVYFMLKKMKVTQSWDSLIADHPSDPMMRIRLLRRYFSRIFLNSEPFIFQKCFFAIFLFFTHIHTQEYWDHGSICKYCWISDSKQHANQTNCTSN